MKPFADWTTRLVARSYSVVVILAAWEIVCRFGLVPPGLLPPISAVLARTAQALLTPFFLYNLGQTLIRLMSGLAAAIVLGVAIGVAASQSRALRRIVEPLIRLFAPIPKIALYPALLLVLGFDHASRIALVLIDAVFPVLLAAYHGAGAVDEKLIWSARAAGLSARGCTWRIVFPAALPGILVGVRIAVVIACIVVYLSEMIQPGDGLGDLMTRAARSFHTVDMFVPIVVISLLGFAMDHALALLRRRLLIWA